MASLLSIKRRLNVCFFPVMPYARDDGIAEFTLVPVQVIGGDVITPPPDDQLSAMMAVSIVPLMAGDIAEIDITDAHLHGQLTKIGQYRNRCGRDPIELVFREKP